MTDDTATQPGPKYAWSFNRHTASWWLRDTPAGSYRIRFSGWDFRVYNYAPGSQIGVEVFSHLDIAAARAAAEADAEYRATALTQNNVQNSSSTMLSRRSVINALRTAIDLADTALPDVAKNQRDVAQDMIDSIADLLGLQPHEYNPHLAKTPTKEP